MRDVLDSASRASSRIFTRPICLPPSARSPRRARRKSAGGAAQPIGAARRRAGDGQGQYRHQGRADAARHGGERPDARRRPTRRPRRDCAKRARSCSPRRRCPTTACCRRACPASTRWRAIRGTSRAIPAARRPARPPPRRRATGRCIVGTDIGGSVRLPAGWCGLVGLKPSGGRMPIDPPYIGRVAGPMTRSVADAALMMATLAKPDARDYTSLPPQALDWRVEPARLARPAQSGCCSRRAAAIQPTPTVSAASRARGARLRGRRRDRRAARAVPDPGDARRARPLLAHALADRPSRAARPEQRAKVLPFIRAWAESATGLDGETVFRGFNQMRGDGQGGGRRDAALRLRLSPTAPITAYPAEWASPSNDPLNPVSAYRLHRRLQHVGAAGGDRSIAAMTTRACRSACRSSAAASTISACSRRRWRSRRCAPARRGRGPNRRLSPTTITIRRGNAMYDYSKMFDLTGRRALVIGGASGIGRASCFGLASFGAQVICGDLSHRSGQGDGAGDQAAGGRLGRGVADRPAATARALRRPAQRSARSTCSSISPSINVRKPLLDYTDDEFDRVVGLNLKGVFRALKRLRTRRWRRGARARSSSSPASARKSSSRAKASTPPPRPARCR